MFLVCHVFCSSSPFCSSRLEISFFQRHCGLFLGLYFFFSIQCRTLVIHLLLFLLAKCPAQFHFNYFTNEITNFGLLNPFVSFSVSFAEFLAYSFPCSCGLFKSFLRFCSLMPKFLKHNLLQTKYNDQFFFPKQTGRRLLKTVLLNALQRS